MAKPKLTYFDAPVSRGEECRLALHVAGVEFEDHRLTRDAWMALKPTTPYGSVPILELPGRPALAHSNAILVYVGQEHGIHPADAFEAARHLGMMEYAEELRAHVSPTMRIKDDEAKKAARVELAANYLPTWGANVEKQIGEGPFFAGAKLHVVDLKLFMVVGWFRGGALDHIPRTVLAPFPKLNRLVDAVGGDPRVKAWYARS